MGKQAKSKKDDAERELGIRMLKACSEGEADLVKKLIGVGAPLEFGRKKSGTPLHAAVKARSLECVMALLEAGASTAAKDRKGRAALRRCSDSKIAEALLDAGAKADARDRKGRTALIWGAKKGHDAVVELLARRGADVNRADRSGRTAAMLAVEGHEVAILEALAKAGAKVDWEAAKKEKTFWWGAGADLAGMMLDNGQDIDDVGMMGGWSLLMHAVDENRLELAKALIERGADFSIADANGNTAVLRAAIHNRHECMAALLEKGADGSCASTDACTQENDGKTAAMWAASQGSLESLRVLIKHGVDLDARDKAGLSAAMWAARESESECLGLLLASGCDFELKDGEGLSARDWSIKSGCDESRHMLDALMEREGLMAAIEAPEREPDGAKRARL